MKFRLSRKRKKQYKKDIKKYVKNLKIDILMVGIYKINE